MRLTARSLHDDAGFSMIPVIIIMMVTGLFVAGAFASANGDLPFSRQSQDRKRAYAAAEAAVNFYQFHLNQDGDYWARCTNVAPPNASEPSPVNQLKRPGTTDTRAWRRLPDSPAEYTVELVPAPNHDACQEGNGPSMLDPRTGTIRIRATGRSGGQRPVKRSVNVAFRRNGFLDFLYFTDYETTDPAGYPSGTDVAWATENCGDKYRVARNAACSEIVWANADRVRGPMHTNDDLLTCGAPEFGRDMNDRVEVSGPSPGWRLARGCSGSPVFKSEFKYAQQSVVLPSTNAKLAAVAQPEYLFTGTTRIRLRDAVMDVTTWNGSRWVTRTDVRLPANGVIYVRNDVCTPGNPPVMADYDREPVGCGNVYVSGRYARSLTIAAENDIIVAPPPGESNADIIREGDVLLGLIANNYVRVYHRVDRPATGATYDNCTNTNTASHPLMRNVTIHAAILSLKHSFTTDNHRCGGGGFLGTATVVGAIAQKYRGPMGSQGGPQGQTGFIKNYVYDDRFRYRSPPHFLEPVESAWRVIRSNEQVPAS